MQWTVECADVLTWCEDYAAKIERGEAEPFHAILTDPPYGLSDTPDMAEVLTHWLAGDDYEHKGGGFMGKSWDGFVPGPSTWAALRRVCHPGAYLFAFGGTRTADLLSMAIRLGGWERFDEIDSLSWCYGSGFPKSHSIGKAIDREAKVKREVVGPYIRLGDKQAYPSNTSSDAIYGGGIVQQQTKGNITAPATPLAAAWEGYGTALKPAHEPILCFRNPKQGTYAQNCTSTGAGALWIDGARVGFGQNGDGEWHSTPSKGTAGIDKGTTGIYGYYGGNAEIKDNIRYTTQGRWPPNVCITHLPGCERLGVKRVRAGVWDAVPKNSTPGNDGKTMGTGWRNEPGQHPEFVDPDGLEPVTAYACVLACDGCGHQWTAEQRGDCPECGGEARWACAVGALNEQAGPSVARPVKPENIGKSGDGQCKGLFGNGSIVQSGYYDDSASVSRFYPQHDWQHEIAERLAGVTPFYYCAKSARRERDAGLEGPEVQQKRVGQTVWTNCCVNCEASRPQKEKVCGKCGGEMIKDERQAPKARNPHPCIKPLSLCKWLATLILPPPEYAPRRILIPFGGVMSDAAGAVLAGWDEIVAVEMEEEYIPIGEARLRFWADWAARGYDDPAAILKTANQRIEKTQLEMSQMELAL